MSDTTAPLENGPPRQGECPDPVEMAVAVDALPTTVEAAAVATALETPDTAAGRDRRRRRARTNRAFRAIKAQHASERSVVEAIADRLTAVASSTPFLLFHVAWFLVWIPWNTGLLGLRPFDPYPFGFLTMVVSLEAIFLSIFVLMSQSRESAIAELREEVTLQVNLRMEEEVTKTLQLVAGLYTRLGHRVGEDQELLEMLQPLDTDAIERELIEQIRECGGTRERA